jgi:hypothetical protein
LHCFRCRKSKAGPRYLGHISTEQLVTSINTFQILIKLIAIDTTCPRFQGYILSDRTRPPISDYQERSDDRRWIEMSEKLMCLNSFIVPRIFQFLPLSNMMPGAPYPATAPLALTCLFHVLKKIAPKTNLKSCLFRCILSICDEISERSGDFVELKDLH